MKDTLEKIQAWYQIHCNGDWEHKHGLSIISLDNPGWFVTIDLHETALEQLNYQKEYQNPSNENDWYNFNTKNFKLEIACGPNNLEQVIDLFFDEVVPVFANQAFYYTIYLPLQDDEGKETKLWTPAKAKMVDGKTLQISEIKEVDNNLLRDSEFELVQSLPADLPILSVKHAVGDSIGVALEYVFDGIILTAKDEN